MYSKIKPLAGGLALIWGLFLAKGVSAAGTPASAAVKANTAIPTVRLEKQPASTAAARSSLQSRQTSSVQAQKTASSKAENTAAKQNQSRISAVKSSPAAAASAKKRESRQKAPVIKAKQARPSSQSQIKAAAASSSSKQAPVKKSRQTRTYNLKQKAQKQVQPHPKQTEPQKPAKQIKPQKAVKEGFKKEGRNTYYYRKGRKIYGFQRLNRHRYYFVPGKGQMLQNGEFRIQRYYYLFNRLGQMQFGFQRQGRYLKYYNKKGHQLHGYHKIRPYWYLFNKHGQMLTGLRYIKARRYYGYFNGAGHQRFRSVNTRLIKYSISTRNGRVTGVLNHARVIRQLPELPTGCEVTSVTMMLQHAGKKVSKLAAARIMHRSSNPYRGFMGSPFSNIGVGLWVAPQGIRSVVQHYLHRSKIMTGCSLNAIRAKLRTKHLVCAWVSAVDGFSSHTIALTGYSRNRIYYNDPWTGRKSSFTNSSFLYHWRLNGRRALSY